MMAPKDQIIFYMLSISTIVHLSQLFHGVESSNLKLQHQRHLNGLDNHPQTRTRIGTGFTASKPESGCTNINKGEARRREKSRHRRHADHLPVEDLDDQFYYQSGMVLSFSGNSESLVYIDDASNWLPRDAFTVMMWVKAEGGQHNPISILGVFDKCDPAHRNQGWSLDIRTSDSDSPSYEQDARFEFHLKGGRVQTPTVLSGAYQYMPNRWTHIAATYNQKQTLFYIDGSRVGRSLAQTGTLFSTVSVECKQLILGGDFTLDKYFRGQVDELKIFGQSLTPNEINMHMKNFNDEKTAKSALVYDAFNDLSQWKVRFGEPMLKHNLIPSTYHDFQPKTPPCGITLCDDPEVIRSYSSQNGLRSQKTVRYRVINVFDDVGGNPTVTEEQIAVQHRALNNVFNPYNISWEMEEVRVLNSSLREKTILIACDPAKVGNGQCNPECRHERTGFDGGDCDLDPGLCQEKQLNNGICDSECNTVNYNWDAGDCCKPEFVDTSLYCFDPSSNHRAFLGIDEYKKLLDSPSDHQLNIYFAFWTHKSLVGLATFPWEMNVYNNLGGTVVRPDNFGKPGNTNSLVHEIGHNLGLWHVHHGISEMDCSNPCMETHASLELGDLCGDTNPTPQNQQCSDPFNNNQCGFGSFSDTPYDNYMSYADDSCTNHFTNNQVARMHCYLDLVYLPWMKNPKPPPVPTAPKIMGDRNHELQLIWMEPMGSGAHDADIQCSQCSADGVLHQFAHKAWSPGTMPTRYEGAPHQATGSPNAEQCTSSPYAWVPEQLWCESDCFIELQFKYDVVPTRLAVWVTWDPYKAISGIEMVMKDESILKISSEVPTYCDMPYTVPITTSLVLHKVRIYIRVPLVAIDAVSIESSSNNILCEICRDFSYIIHRDPPFKEIATSNVPYYTDTDVLPDQIYKYQITVSHNGRQSERSPKLEYQVGTSYCGNGKIDIDLGEECDDGFLHDGDGCDHLCKLEKHFKCKGNPSACYNYKSDGICEEFEESNSIHDCGLYTPAEYEDQWAVRAAVNPDYQSLQCPEDVITGPPNLNSKCSVHSFNKNELWYPCNVYDQIGDIWVEVAFDHPVVATHILLYIAMDITYDPYDTQMDIFLIAENGEEKPVGRNPIKIDCRIQPIVIEIVQSISDIFLTKGILLQYLSTHIAISAVGIRSHKFFSPYQVSLCSRDEVYQPQTKRCVPYSCTRPLCHLPRVPKGHVLCNGHREGDKCNVSCIKGYELVNPSKSNMQCIDGKWEGEKSMKCIHLDCKYPIIPYARIDCPDGTRYGKRCKFECKSPAVRKGRSNAIECMDDGLWSLPQSFCMIMCKNLTDIKDAVMLNSACSSGKHSVGTQCQLQCKPGYHVAGKTSNVVSLEYTCDKDGMWKGPHCERVQCARPDDIYTDLYSCSDAFFVNSECILKCPEPNRVIITAKCQVNGEWDEDFTRCKFEPGICPELKHSNSLAFLCNDRSIGTRCSLECKGENQYPILRRLQRRSLSKLRFMYTRVHNLTCTGRQIWYPSVDEITCVDQFTRSSIGDGWCDALNNVADGDWDGGDCCPSTVRGGVVRPYPEACTDACRCLDPQAEESHPSTNELLRNRELQRKIWNNNDVDRTILTKS